MSHFSMWGARTMMFFSQKTVNNMTFQELLYADDALAITKNTQTAKDYLRYIEEESEYYNIKLNRNKCVCITDNRNNQITFADGQKLKCVDETMNLGTQINKRVNPKIEINRRISSTMPILKRLTCSGNKRGCQPNGKFKYLTQFVFPNSCAAWKHCSQQKPRQVNWILSN